MFYFSSRLKVQTGKTFSLEAAQREIQLEAQMFALLHSFYPSIAIALDVEDAASSLSPTSEKTKK